MAAAVAVAGEPSIDWALCDVVAPRPAARLPGVEMAGFSLRVPTPVDIAMVAHPAVTLLVDLNVSGDGLIIDGAGHSRHGSVVVGMLPGEVRVSGHRGDCLQIRLEPAVAAAVFRDADGLLGSVVSLDDLWGRGAGDRAEERLRAAGSWEERFALARQLLVARLAGGRTVDPEVAHIWGRTRTSCGQVRVDGLADEVGWSRKRLSARFRSQLGITPKLAARLVRFDRAVHLLAAGRTAAAVAAESGYTDQSHLHREVREFSGLTPTRAAASPWLEIDDVAWPGASAVRASGARGPGAEVPVARAGYGSSRQPSNSAANASSSAASSASSSSTRTTSHWASSASSSPARASRTS